MRKGKGEKEAILPFNNNRFRGRGHFLFFFSSSFQAA
jgi:hypothetical protein